MGLAADVEMAAACVGAGNDSGDTHVEEGVGLALRVHTGEAIDEAGDQVFPGAVDDARAFGNGHIGAGADGE